MEVNKDRYVAEALKLFLKKGYESATIRDIAKTCGISHSKLIYHFGSKSALGLVVAEEYLSWLLERIESVQYSDGDDRFTVNRVIWWGLHYSVILYHGDFARFFLELNDGSSNPFLEATDTFKAKLFGPCFGIDCPYDSTVGEVDAILLNRLDIALYGLCYQKKITPYEATYRLLGSGVMPSMKTEISVSRAEDLMKRYRVGEEARGFDPYRLTERNLLSKDYHTGVTEDD